MALRAAARLHGFELDEEHVPFGGDATMRFGHPFPLASRNAALAADAILAATIDPALLQSLEGELDLRAAVDARLAYAGPRSRSSRRSAPTRGTGRSSVRSPLRARAGVTSTFVGSEDGWTARRRGASDA